MAKKERKKITQTRAVLAQGIAVSESPSADTNAHVVAGYRSGNLNEALASPEVARAVKAGLVRRLIAEAAPLSMGLLIKAVKAGHAAYDKGEQATTTHVDAAKALMNMTGIQQASEELTLSKTVGEMNGAELHAAMREIQDTMAKQGSIEVDGTVSAPSDAPTQGQATDNKDYLFS